MMKTYGVIMAGGGGTRFWPLSRKGLPKQFLNLTGKGALVNETFDRLCQVADSEDIFVVTNELYSEKTYDIMHPRIKKTNILSEPQARNTAACIGYAAMEILRKHGDGVMCIMPSDHYIKDERAYAETISRAVELAEEKNCLVTIGIKPEYPETGYGYIRSRTATGKNGKRADYYHVEEFVEKPCKAVAEEYVKNGYCWNSGMFVWKASVILDYFRELLPKIYGCLDTIGQAMGTEKEYQVLHEVYGAIPQQSIDYGIMEKADKVLMLEGRFGWNDVGSLDALELLHAADGDGNVCFGRHIVMDTKDSICYSNGRMIVAVGVKDMMIVETDDIVMVCPKSRSQEVKKVVEELEKQGYKDYL